MKHLARISLHGIVICTWVVLSIGVDKLGSPAFAQDRANKDVEIETEYDRSKNETTVSVGDLQVLHSLSNDLYLSVEAKYATTSPKKLPQEFTVFFISISPEGFKYPDVSLLTVVADGKHLPPKRTARLVKNIDGGSYMEANVTIMIYKYFMQIVQAKVVEMQLHESKFRLSDQHLQKLREFASLLHSEGTAGREIEQGGASGLSAPDKPTESNSAKDVPQSKMPVAASAELNEASQLHQQVAKLYTEGRYDEAIVLAQRSLEMLEKALGPKPFNVAASINNLALLHKVKGNYVQAEMLYKRALEILKKEPGEEHPAFATTLDNLASVYVAKGDYVNAESLSSRALKIFVKVLGPKDVNVATTLNNLALVYKQKGDYIQSEKCFLGAIEILEETLGPERLEVASVIDNLAFLYGEQGYAQAESMHKRALKIYEKVFGPEHPDVARALNNLALWYRQKGDYAQAEPLLVRALTIYEKALGVENPELAASLSNLAALYEAKGDTDRALSFRVRSNDILEHNLSLILTTGSENQKQLYLNNLFNSLHLAVSLHVRSAPRDKQAAQLAVTAILQRKGRGLDAMTDQIGVLRRHAAPQDQKLLDRWAATRSQLATLQISGRGQLTPEVRRTEVERLTVESERLEDEMSRRSAEFRAQALPITFDAVRQALPADAALVEIFSYEPFDAKTTDKAKTWGAPRYVAYVARRDEAVPEWVELGEAATIDAEVERLREALKDPKRTDIQTVARALDERVMRPIRKLLGPTHHVFLSPDGALNLIPFAALVDENGKYLIENYSLTYLTSGRDLLRLQIRTENRSAPMLIANPLYDFTAASRPKLSSGQAHQPANQTEANRRSMDFTLKSYAPLSGTAEEAAALTKLLPQGTQILLQEQATEAALKQANRPRVLHIATHGFFLTDQPQELPSSNRLLRGTFDTLDGSPLPARWENPLLRSGLLLAGVKQGRSGPNENGVLTALETAGLDLWGTKLVVLSACETGLGDVKGGAGVYGLRRALVLAGSETQVMSLWKVSDAGTRDLMVAYYTRLQKEEGRAEALRQVQLSMLHRQLLPAASSGTRETSDMNEKDVSKDYRHPYYWAAFIPSGDWRSMDGK